MERWAAKTGDESRYLMAYPEDLWPEQYASNFTVENAGSEDGHTPMVHNDGC